MANADAQGFVDEVGPRCNADNEALGIARTTDSLIVVCRTGVDRLYYKGIRVEDGSGIEIDDPIVVADGFQVTNAGVTYRFDDSACSSRKGERNWRENPCSNSGRHTTEQTDRFGATRRTSPSERSGDVREDLASGA